MQPRASWASKIGIRCAILRSILHPDSCHLHSCVYQLLCSSLQLYLCTHAPVCLYVCVCLVCVRPVPGRVSCVCVHTTALTCAVGLRAESSVCCKQDAMQHYKRKQTTMHQDWQRRFYDEMRNSTNSTQVLNLVRNLTSGDLEHGTEGLLRAAASEKPPTSWKTRILARRAGDKENRSDTDDEESSEGVETDCTQGA